MKRLPFEGKHTHKEWMDLHFMDRLLVYQVLVRSIILDRKLDVEHFLNERTHKPNQRGVRNFNVSGKCSAYI